MKKILFIGNSFLRGVLHFYRENKNILGEKFECSFYMNISGWGPEVLIENNIIKNKYNEYEINNEGVNTVKELFYPENTKFDIRSFDIIIIMSLGYIGYGLDIKPTMSNYGLISDYIPKNNKITDIPISKAAYREMFNGFMAQQPGISLINEIANIDCTKIVIEQPYLNERIVSNPDWVLDKLYENPIGAYKFFNNLRKDFLQKICTENGIILIPSRFNESEFVPASFFGHSDHFHPSFEYTKLIFEDIKKHL